VKHWHRLFCGFATLFTMVCFVILCIGVAQSGMVGWIIGGVAICYVLGWTMERKNEEED